MTRVQGISASLILSPEQWPFADEIPIIDLSLKEVLVAQRTGKMKYVEFEGAMLLAVEDKWLQDYVARVQKQLITGNEFYKLMP